MGRWSTLPGVLEISLGSTRIAMEEISSEPAKQFVQWFAERRQDRALRRPWVLWLGSYISAVTPSLIPLADEIFAAVIRELATLTPENKLKALTRRAQGDLLPQGRLSSSLSDVPFEVKLGEIEQHTGSFVSGMVKALLPLQTPPNANHDAIVQLFKTGELFDLIVTTNFDECLESLFPFCRIVPVGAPFSVPSGRPLVKLHGTISDPKTIATTMRALAFRTVGGKWTHSVIEMLANKDVLF